MVSLKVISDWLQGLLNANEKQIVFNIQADRNKYDTARQKVEGFVVPGVLTALQGSYEPVKAIKVYNMPVMLELWGYSGIHREPFNAEDQKAIVGGVVEELNGNTFAFGDDAIIVSGGTVTVGESTGQGGGGYLRIPILVTLQLTVVQKALLSNDVEISLDGERIYFLNFTIGKEKQGESQTIVGTNVSKTMNARQLRTFSGSCYMTESAVLTLLENDILGNISVNKSYTLKYKTNSFTVTLQSGSEILRMGGIVQMSLTFVEVLDNL